MSPASSNDSPPSSAVVLAAGEGTRLRPLTANRPKPMLPAGTRPILEHVLNALVDAGVDDIHLADSLDRPIDKPRNLAKSVTVE